MRTEKEATAVQPLLERKLLALPEAVAELRHAVRNALGSSTRSTGDVQLCVSEIVTNVITHLGPGTPVTLRITAREDGPTRVALTDPDPRTWPVLRQATDDEESGRGLALLDALSLHWGIEQAPDNKTVWCELDGR